MPPVTQTVKGLLSREPTTTKAPPVVSFPVPPSASSLPPQISVGVKTGVRAAILRSRMSRFSFAMHRSSAETEPRPSVTSLIELNNKLMEETKKRNDEEIHLFLGPQTNYYDSKDKARVMHGERTIHKNRKRVWLQSEPLPSADMGNVPDAPNKGTLLSGTVNTFAAASKFLGQKVAQMKTLSTFVNEDSFCDGCGMDPIIGTMMTCSQCDDYNLCETCYQSGVHGYEDSTILRSVREDFALRSAMELCRNKVPEQVFEVLLRKVCKGQIDKFQFMSSWISKVVLGVDVSEFSVRGIEISNLDNEARSILVQKLTPVLTERIDLEIRMEWFHPDILTNTLKNLETLRIWVATDTNTKSPFQIQNTDPTNRSSSSHSSLGSPRSPISHHSYSDSSSDDINPHSLDTDRESAASNESGIQTLTVASASLSGEISQGFAL